ncbi:GyrI-like domain-containing protein [Candidatus Pollutiaquabacter sp.]|uniref:GyrI-like domain-containing protein n=1 Tax=Candidatus Pollutiaquabacter sp. TaxID=3416354 RepID=UPI003C98D7F8|nr:GyrI-like domain-containing protein [Bacteroidota bacterium]
MSIQPEIRTIPSFRLIGMSQRQSLVQNTTAALWKRFMPRRGELRSMNQGVLYSLEVYDGLDHFAVFDPAREFTKWAAVEVGLQEAVPDGMNELEVPGGRYAVFLYRGRASKGADLYRYIFTQWLPGYGYSLDDRPHFARMDERYKGEAEDSEEEIWVPVR